MDATVTLKLSPREFDLVRTCVEVRQKQQEERGRGSGAHDEPVTVRASRKEAIELNDILQKLR